MDASILEAQTRSGNQVLDRARHEHVTRPRQRRDPSTDVHRDATELVTDNLALAGVNPGADVETETSNGLDDRTRSAGGPGRTVERGEEPVTGRIDLTPAEAGEVLAHHAMVRFEEITPPPVAQRGGPFGGTNQVCEQHGGQDAVRLDGVTRTGEELLDLVQDRGGITQERRMIIAGQLDVPGPRNVLGQVTGIANVDRLVALAMEDKGGHTDRRRDVADVDLRVHACQRQCRSGAGTQAPVGREPSLEVRVGGATWAALTEVRQPAPVLHGRFEEHFSLCFGAAHGCSGDHPRQA